MKRILIFSTAYFPFVGGAEVAIKEITDRAQNFKFDMITARMDRRLPKQERVGNINVYRVGIGWAKFDKYLLAFRGAKLAQKLHKKNKYSVIWAMMASYNGFAALEFKRRNKKVPYLLTLQEGDSFEYILKRVGFLKNRFKNIFIKADSIQTISRYLADWARDMGATKNIEVVPNGVDINQFSISSPQFSIKDFREKIGIRNNEKIIFTASRLVKKNGIDSLIRSMEYLSNEYRLLIAGKGEEENNLKKMAQELKLKDRIIFLGFISQTDLPKYYWASDVFCRPSLSEGQGISFLEAMAAEIPVVATPVGGIVDFLADNETGLICEVNNPKSIAEKIKLILGNTELRERIIKNAKKMIADKYDWNNISKDMENIFIDLTRQNEKNLS